MASTILSFHVRNLRLRVHAPFPSQLVRPGKWLKLRSIHPTKIEQEPAKK